MGTLTTGASTKRTICEVHREIYDIVEKIDGMEKVISLLEEAFDMAKRMNAKLIEYKGKSDLPPNPNYSKSRKYRMKRDI